ncbi:MAG: hypothetical protein CMJ33_00265 [Phycisphaerae bacterium]|nr:hypothetical protein [Phycisphaerae bacterium]
MPELPEVERGRLVAEKTAVGRTCLSVHGKDDSIVFCDQSRARIARALKNKLITRACRHGKQLWLEFENAPALLIHFGMTGSLQAYPEGQEPPRFSRVELRLTGGIHLAMPDPRRFGRIRMRDDPRNEPPISMLGFDPLHQMPDKSTFRDMVVARRTTIKGLLLNQKFCAGIGNWIADEILYQAGIDPRTRTDGMDDSSIERVRRWTRKIIERSVEVNANSSKFPRTWLFHERWGKPEGALTRRGEAIEIMTVAGRTTAWVPSAQS